MGPAIKQLRDALPKATIDFLVEPASFPIVEKNPHLNTVLVYDKKTHFSELRRIRSRGYDAVLDFMSNPRTTAIALTSGAKWRAAFKVGPRSLLYNVRVAGLAVPEYVPKRRVRLVQEFLSKIGVTVERLRGHGGFPMFEGTGPGFPGPAPSYLRRATIRIAIEIVTSEA